MKSKPFRFHPEAREEFRGSIRWYWNESPRVAIEFRIAVSNVVRRIVQAPKRWPEYLYGTRRVVLQRFPFSVIYLEQPAAISLVAVVHSKRRPGYWKKRIKSHK